MRVVLTTQTIPQTLIKPTMELYKIKTLFIVITLCNGILPLHFYFSATTSIFTCTCFVNTLNIACKSSFSCMFMFVHPCTSELQFSSKVLWFKNQAIYFIHSRINWICQHICVCENLNGDCFVLVFCALIKTILYQ